MPKETSKTVKVVTTVAMRAVLEQLETELSRRTGHGIEQVFGPPPKAVEMVREGETADVVIATPDGIAALAAAGKVVPGTAPVVARMIMGIAVREGAPKPDISTPEAFRKAILDAGSLIHADPATGSPSAAHFIKVAERLGITDAIRGKTQVMSGLVGGAVADGRAEIGIQQLAELRMVPGLDVVGPFPGELQNVVPIAAGIHAEAAAPEAARALLDILATPEAHAIIDRAGMLPGG